MKKMVLNSIGSVIILAGGFFLGWWANSPAYDLLCSKPSVFVLKKELTSQGISLASGTEVNLRACEYANRFSVSLYTEKGSVEDLFQFKNSSPNIGSHGAAHYRMETQ